MYIRNLRDEASGEVSYLLADMRRREAVLIDPRAPDSALMRALLSEHQLTLRWILRTHHHDSRKVGEWNALLAWGAPIVQGDPRDGAYAPRDGERFHFGTEWVVALHTPGHTAHCLSFQWRDRLYCGGLVDVAQCPYQPFALQPEQLWDSSRALLNHPPETLLFSGHAQDVASVTSLSDQRRLNPYFGDASRDEFLLNVAALPERCHPDASHAFTPTLSS